MYIYDGSKYTEEEIQNAADKAGLSLEEYTSKNNITFEEEVDFPTSAVADADAVQQPMTASQAGYTEPKDTASSSVVGLSDSRIEEIEKNFKVGYYHPEQREAYKNWEETGKVDGSLLPDFNVDDYKKTERVINDDFRKEVEKIYQESAKGVKLDKFGSFDYDDKESIANFRDRAINKLIKENKTIQDKILPQATSQAKFEFDSANDKLKEKYGINSKNVSQENIDNYTKEATAQFNALVNSKVNSTPEFKQIITDFNSVMDETGRVGLEAFTRGKDWEGLMSLERGLQASNNPLSKLVFKFIQQTYAGGKQIKDGLDEAGVYGAIQMNERFISQLDDFKGKETNKIKNKYLEEGYTEEQASLGANEDIKSQKGWWRESEDDLANAFKFVKITSENQTIPSGVTKGTFQDYENSVNKKTEAEDLSIRERLIDVADQQLATSAYGTDEFKNFMKGDNMLENSVSMVGKQLLPQMGIAILTAGVGNAIQMGSGMYVDGINNKIREKYGLSDEEEITQDMLKNVISDDEFIDVLVTKSVAGGFLAGQLERLGAGKLLSNLTNEGAASILRTGIKRYAQRVGGQTIRNFSTGATEAITEVLQEVLSASVAGGELDKEQLFEAGGTGFLVSAMTGLGGNVITQTVQEVKTLNRIVAGKLNPESAEAFFNTKSAEIDNILKTETNPSKIQELKEKKQSILDARNANLKIPSNFSTAAKEKIFNLVEEKQNIEKEIKNKDPELVRNQTDRIKEINTELNVISSLETQVKTVEKLTKDVKGLKVESLDNAEAISNFIEENNIDVDGKKASQQQGFIYQDPKTGEQIIIINKEVAAKEYAVNVAAHEFLHGLLFQTVKNSPETQVALGKSLNEYINKIDATQVKDSNFAKRLESYKDMDEATQSEEVLTLFSDAIATGDIQFNESVFTKIGDVIRRTLQNLGVKVKFNNGKDVYNFVKDYNKSIEKGKLTKAQKEISKKGATGSLVSEQVQESKPGIKESKQLTPEQDTQLRSDVAEIKEEASKGEALAKQFNKDFVKGAKQTRLENKVLQEIKPVVDRVVTNRTKALYDPIAEDAKKNVSRQMFQESMRSDIESMVFDEFTGKQDLEKFIVNRAFLRANNLAERLGIKSAEEGITKGLEAAEKVAVEETSAPKADKPKYRNILKSNTLPTETVNTIKDKVLKTVRTLKSKLDTKVSINKTVTPLVAEIKKNMGKQADIDFKKAMGGKKDAQLRRFLIKNKRVVLENMTTTWLMGAMPGAVQKQVNGSFTSDWQGKKIDREKTSTQQAGRTSGAEIVRRLPNAFKNLDDKTYLSYIIDESGAPIRGRKESLAKAMAEELSFDIFTTELQNENSDIRKAFEGNQEALGVVLVDNYIQEVTRDVERGTVKFSKSLSAEQKKTVLAGAEKLKNKLLNANITLTSKSLLPILIDTYPSIDEKTLKEFAKESIQVVQRYTSDKTIDRTKNVDFGKFLFEGISLKESNSNLIKFFNFAKNEVKSLGGLFNNNNLVAKQRELEFTYNNNLVEKEGADGLIKILRWGRGHQATSGKIGGGRNQSYAGNGDYIANNLNNIPGVDVVWNPKTNRINDVKFNGKSIEDWKKRIKSPAQKASGGIDQFKKEAKEREDAAREAWVYLTDYLQHVKDNGNAIDWTMTMMSLKSNMSSVLKAAAPVKYYFAGDVKGSLRYEHMIPTEYMVLKLTDYYFNGKKFDLNTLRDKYNVAIIPVSMDDNFNILTQSQMNSAFDPMTDPEFDRYYNENTFGFPNMYAIEALTGEYKGQIIGKSWVDFNNILKPQAAKMSKSVQTEQKAIDNARSVKWSKSTKKIRVFDFDDTLARTKSNVLYTMPGEVRVFHGGDIKSVKDIDGFVYFSEDQKQASAYAKGNQGEVSSFKIDETSLATEDQVFDVINALGIKPRAGYAVEESSLYELIDPRFEQSFSKKDLEKLAVALKRKGIKAARFTDTNISQGKNEGRETENIVVFDKKTVQEQAKLTAAEFAAKSDEMAAKGADFDFIEFSKVMNGQEGPLLKVAKIIAEKRGTDDLFVLTARPQDAAGPIQDFLAELGLDIPLENITGLADGNPKAKADWMVGKVAEGYNDFYFADDHLGNVKAVKDVFNTFDVKGKVQQAKIKFSKGLDKGFNDMIERQTGTESFKEFSKGVAQRRGKKVGKFKIFVSPSAEDFRGLTQYKFAGKGKQGEADQKFFEEALMDPYFKGVAALESAREVIKNDTKALFKIFKPVKKKLNKLVPGIDFTYDGAVRVYLWNKAGIEIPGLTKRDNKKLNDTVANDPELSAFADALLLVSKQDTWPAPTEYWEAKTTLSDLNTLTEKTNRKEYLQEFIENVDIIFSEKNLNKVEALYGKASRTAIENAIYAMKTGSNSPNQNGDVITNRWLKWVNNSIGTIMFFNRRSALLQLTSATNFLNWSDNNPAKAALAFANQPQYWKDWAMIFNSDKLKQRRSGLKSDVQESEIANAAKNTEDKIGSIIAYLLKIGFSPTQIADSIAISSGGATFYRNRVNTYKKQGLDVKEAEAKAFEDFSKLSDEAQQSGDPALVSQQQRSVAGRLILSFQNTTMQYTRLMKKAGQDLVNRRGDPKTHISKILYYGALQNLIFNALSQTAFALIPGFDEEEDEDEAKRDEKLEEKASRVLNGMTDSIIRGTGIYGAVVTTIKNTFNTWKREADKGFKGDQAKTLLEAANISPAIGSKLRKIYSAIQAYQFDKAVMEKHPWSVTIDGKFNPSATYSVIGSLASATLNLPLDRALAEARGVAEMFDNRNSEMQRIALALGWRTWNVGAKNEEFDLIKMEAKAKKKEEGKIKAKETRAKNRKIKKLENERRDKAFNTLNSTQRKEIFQMNTTDRKAYLDKIAKQKGIK